jgi:hypothetical protein
MVEATEVQIDTSAHRSMLFDCTDDPVDNNFSVTVDVQHFQPKPRKPRKPLTDSDPIVVNHSIAPKQEETFKSLEQEKQQMFA